MENNVFVKNFFLFVGFLNNFCGEMELVMEVMVLGEFLIWWEERSDEGFIISVLEIMLWFVF